MIEVRPNPVVDDSLSKFTADVNRLYDRRAISVLTGACGRPYGVSLPQRPLILAAAKAQASSTEKEPVVGPTPRPALERGDMVRAKN